jgi:hypothetical protein
MINFCVANLDAMMGQFTAAGISITADPLRYPNGQFARFYDPEGDPIKLRQAEPVEIPVAMGMKVKIRNLLASLPAKR